MVYSCTMTAGNVGSGFYGFSQFFAGSIDGEPVPGETLAQIYTNGSSFGFITFVGDIVSTLSGLTIWIDSVEYPFTTDWSYNSGTSRTEGTWTSGMPTFVDTNSYFVEIKSSIPPGDITGVSDSQFTTEGVLRGTGTLSGIISPAFSLSGTLLGSASLTGSTSLTFTTLGAATNPSIFGSVDLEFTSEGNLTGSGRLTGSTGLTFSTSASGISYAFINGSTGLTFSINGDTNVTRIYGTCNLNFTIGGSIEGISILYYETSGTIPDNIYDVNSSQAPFIYYETQGTIVSPIYEEN